MAHGGFDDLDCEPCGAGKIESREFLQSLINDNHASLISFLRRRLGDTDEVNDIAHDLYCEIARRPDTASIEQPRAYLFRAARNFIFNRNRRRRFINADGHIAIEDACEAEVRCHKPSPEEIALSREQLAIVQAALEELSPKCRRAFLLVRYEGRTYREAASEMQLSVKSIEYYMRQALIHIRKSVDNAHAGNLRRHAAE